MRKLTTEEFIKRAVEVHGNTYDYRKTEYETAQDPIVIICRKHGDFTQLPYNHLRGAGCSLCNKVDKRILGFDEFLDKARAVHEDKYDYSQTVFVNTKTSVKIICPVHGIFEQTPNKHMQGQGCPKCAKNHKDDTESFIRKARAVHGDRYDYSKVKYVDQHTKVCIIDPEYGEFWQQPNSHLNGRDIYVRRGQKTYDTKKKRGHVNKTELGIGRLLVEKFGEDNVIAEYWSERYPFNCDFYIRSLDLYIEVNAFWIHGRHWFNSLDENDLKMLVFWTRMMAVKSVYRKAIEVWTGTDVAKRETAKRNRLNYLVFWNHNLSDFLEWYKTFDETHVLKNI